MIKSLVQGMMSLFAIGCVMAVFLADSLVIFGGILRQYAPENVILFHLVGAVFLGYLFICPYHIVYRSRLGVIVPLLLIPLFGFFCDLWYVPVLTYSTLAICGTIYAVAERYGWLDP